MPDGPRDGKQKKQTTTGIAASGIHFCPELWKGAAELADQNGDESDGDHGDGDPGDLVKDDVVQREQRVGVVEKSQLFSKL